MTQALPEYEIYALRYATMARKRQEAFMAFDPHDGPMPIDYFVWVVRNAERTILVDTGFSAEAAQRRGRQFLCSPIDAIARLGIKAADVQDVIITHLHYDHVGGFDQFPNARFHLQDREMSFATGRHMADSEFSHAFTARHVAEMVVAVHAKRVQFDDGDADLAPGISVHHIGGHTDGLQAVRVSTAAGWLVLASDASHYYENMEATRPFPIVFDVAAMVAGYDRLRSLAGPGGAIVPGHDPMVFERYPAADPSLSGVAVRLG